MLTEEQCTKAILATGIITFIFGLITAYFYHKGENNIMFVPLVVGFVSVFIFYYFIEKRAQIRAGKKVDDY